MIRRFKDISIRHKLLVISGVVTFVVLIFSAVLLISSIWINERDAAAIELKGIANLIGANSTAALIFNDEATAQEILNTLGTDPDVTIGTLYDASGNEFSRYQREGHEQPSISLIGNPYDTFIDGMTVTTYQPVTMDGDIIGSILLQSNLQSRLVNLQNALLPIFGVLIATFCLAMAIASKLTRSIISPIKDLCEVIDRVSQEDDYSLRSRLNQNDEIGILSGGVNDMLMRIEERDAEINAQRQHLEEQVAERTSALQQANQRIKAELSELARAESELKDAHRNLELQHRNFSLLSEMNDRLQICHAIDELKPVVVHYLRKLFSSTSGGLFVFNHSRSLVESMVTWGNPASIESVFKQDDCWALRQGRLHVVEDPETGLVCPHCVNDSIEPYICAPMIAYGEVIGALHISGMQPASFSLAMRQVITSAAEHLALAIANMRLREALQMKSVRDPLTGLFNRRYLQETLERELARSNRSSQSTALLMIDVDHFKSFNDIHGHEAGDIVLREFGAFLKREVRAEDIACRYGGEEFIIILPSTDIDDAVKRAEQIRQETKDMHLQHRGNVLPRISVSLGVAISPEHADNVDDLINAADAALYTAKREGRDRIKVSSLDQENSGQGHTLKTV